MPLALGPDDDDDPRRRDALGRVEHGLDERAPRHAVEHLGQGGAHARSDPGGQDHDARRRRRGRTRVFEAPFEGFFIGSV